MARRRFFVDQVRNGQAEITGENAHHLTRVLRVEAGQKFEITDNERAWLASVETARKDLVRFNVIEETRRRPRTSARDALSRAHQVRALRMGGREGDGTGRHAHRPRRSEPQRARTVCGRAETRRAMEADRARSERTIAAAAGARNRAIRSGCPKLLKRSLRRIASGWMSSPAQRRSSTHFRCIRAIPSALLDRSRRRLDRRRTPAVRRCGMDRPHRSAPRFCAPKPRSAPRWPCCLRCGSRAGFVKATRYNRIVDRNVACPDIPVSVRHSYHHYVIVVTQILIARLFFTEWKKLPAGCRCRRPTASVLYVLWAVILFAASCSAFPPSLACCAGCPSPIRSALIATGNVWGMTAVASLGIYYALPLPDPQARRSNTLPSAAD